MQEVGAGAGAGVGAGTGAGASAGAETERSVQSGAAFAQGGFLTLGSNLTLSPPSWGMSGCFTG